MEEKYIVKRGYDHYDTGAFEEIGNREELEKWLEYGLLHKGDEIYKLELIGKVESKTVISIKYNEDDN